MSEPYFTPDKNMLSECCDALASAEIVDGWARCSACGEMAEFYKEEEGNDKRGLTKEKAIEVLKQLQKATRPTHLDADTVLCEYLNNLGHGDVVKEYNKIEKQYI